MPFISLTMWLMFFPRFHLPRVVGGSFMGSGSVIPVSIASVWVIGLNSKKEGWVNDGLFVVWLSLSDVLGDHYL